MSTLLPSLISLFIVLLLQLLLQGISSHPNGLSIKLIHRDSMDSPLYPGNISIEERLSILHRVTDARMAQLHLAINQTVHPDTLQPPVSVTDDGYYYIAIGGIGTFPGNPPFQNYYWVVDTGSSLTWTQCEGCNPCFPQKPPLFPARNSATYSMKSCRMDAECYKEKNDRCMYGFCAYAMGYSGGSLIGGYYATETFSFVTETGAIEAFDGLVFGCGMRQINFGFKGGNDNEIAGILGMGTGQLSLFKQLGDARTGGRFSTCLQPFIGGTRIKEITTFLRFGAAAEFKPNEKYATTPMLDFAEHIYLKLLDISVNRVRLNFPPETFKIKKDYTGGVAVDIGSPFTVMQDGPDGPYRKVKAAIQQHFALFPLRPLVIEGFDLCYLVPIEFNSFPEIVFHFDGADFTLSTVSAFYLGDGYACLAMKPAAPEFKDVTVLIGGHTLSDYRIVFDVSKGVMKFASVACNLDAEQ